MSEVAISNGPASSLDKSLDSLRSGKSRMVCTIPNDTPANKLAILKALSNSVPVQDNLGRTLTIKDVIVQPVELEREENGVKTGVFAEQPRITFVTADDKSFNATSATLLREVDTLFAVFGDGSGRLIEPVDVWFAKEGSGTRRYLTLNYGQAPK